VEKYLSNYDFVNKLACLQNKMSEKFEPDHVKLFDELDDIRTKAILHANQRCRKLKMGQVPFSPRLVIHWNKILAWKLVLRHRRGSRIDSKYLQRTLRKANITDTHLLSELDVIDNLKEARLAYKVIKREAAQHRSTWLEDVAMARSSEGRSSVAQEIKNLMVREQQRREARQIKYALQAQNRRALRSIEVLQSGQWVELDTRQDIETALLHELEARFNQAATTPFCTEPLLSAIGPLGTTPAAQSLLAGNFEPPSDTNYWAKQLLPFLKQIIPTMELKAITPEEHIAGWRRVREKTSAGPSGITIPHLKAHGLSRILSEIDTTMANLPYLFGFSP
jgi:hypothetical protein